MALNNYDQLVNDRTVNNRGQDIKFEKIGFITAPGLARNLSTWRFAGFTPAGTTPTVGMAGAVTCDSSTAGAMGPITAASGGRTLYLSSIEIGGHNPFGVVFLLDRLAHANITNVQATAAFSPVIDGTARLAAGEGAQILVEVTTAMSAAVNERSFTYTNQAGTGGKVTKTFLTVASGVVDSTPYTESYFITLADGDTGVRSIESTTLVSGAATGAYTISLVRVLAKLTLVGGGGSGRLAEYHVDSPNKIPISASSCLFLYGDRAAATSNGFSSGFVRLIET